MITPSHPGLRLRQVDVADRPFLEELYGSVRAPELAPLAWPADQKRAFVAMQFDAQDREWRARYDPAGFFVLLVDGAPAGRLYLARLDGELRIVDLALVPGQRGRGVGSSLLLDLLSLADGEGRAVTLHVERWNPARRLYERLGFRQVGEDEVYLLLERQPTARAPVPSPG